MKTDRVQKAFILISHSPQHSDPAWHVAKELQFYRTILNHLQQFCLSPIRSVRLPPLDQHTQHGTLHYKGCCTHTTSSIIHTRLFLTIPLPHPVEVISHSNTKFLAVAVSFYFFLYNKTYIQGSKLHIPPTITSQLLNNKNKSLSLN